MRIRCYLKEPKKRVRHFEEVSAGRLRTGVACDAVEPDEKETKGAGKCVHMFLMILNRHLATIKMTLLCITYYDYNMSSFIDRLREWDFYQHESCFLQSSAREVTTCMHACMHVHIVNGTLTMKNTIMAAINTHAALESVYRTVGWTTSLGQVFCQHQ